MAMDLNHYRAGAQEQVRIADLFALLPEKAKRALDVGARDGYLAVRLAERADEVVALDLERPVIAHPRVTCVKGNVVSLDYPDRYFDVVLCAEVLEHLPSELLPRACAEIARVGSGAVVIGVPYDEDSRCGRTTCQHCGGFNPPWGHINSFDETILRSLFPSLQWTKATFVGTKRARTNPISTALLDYAGNPFGTYHQEEPCIHCGKPLGRPAQRTLLQRLATRVAFLLTGAQVALARPRANWIHVLFTTKDSSAT